MIKENKVIKETTEREKYCDVCGVKVSFYDAETCCKCKKDLCPKCIGHEQDDCDSCDCYCKRCWEIGEPFRAKIIELENQIELNNEEWQRLCEVKSD